MSHREGPGLDLVIAREIQSLTEPFGDLLRAANLYGANWRLTIVSVLAACALLVRGFWVEAALVIGSSIPRGLQEIAKAVFDAERPTPDLLIVRETSDTAAYPSGHVVGTTVVFVLVILLVPLALRSPWLVWAVYLASLVMLFAVPVARVWSGAHWPSDLVGGWLFAALWLVPVLWLYQRYVDRKETRLE